MNTSTSYIEVTGEQIIEKLSRALVNTQLILEKNNREQPRVRAAESRLRGLTTLITLATAESKILLSLEDAMTIQEFQL